MSDKLNVKEGDKIIVVKSGYCVNKKTVSTVLRVTPTGRIKVKGYEYYQFDKFGQAMGKHAVWDRVPYLEPYSDKTEQEIKVNAYIDNCRNIMSIYAGSNGLTLTYEQAKQIMKILKKTERTAESED